MRFSTIATALLAPLCAQAVVMFTNNAYDSIAAGSPFKLTWSGDGTPVTIYLLKGPTQMLVRVDTVANGVSGFSYTWTPPQSTPAGTYALSITQSGFMNYSPQFFLNSNIAPTFSNTPATTPALSPSPPLSTVGRAILASHPSLPYAEGYPTSPPSQAYAEGYPSHGPIMTAISDFNTPQTTSYATIRPSTPIVIGSSLWLYPTGLMNSSVPTEYKVFPTGVEFEDGATRRGGFSLGCLVAVILLGTALARYAF